MKPAAPEHLVETLPYIPDTQMVFEHIAAELTQPLLDKPEPECSLVRNLYEDSFKDEKTLKEMPGTVDASASATNPEEVSPDCEKAPPASSKPTVIPANFTLEELSPQKEASASSA